jgi:hypothetical protein
MTTHLGLYVLFALWVGGGIAVFFVMRQRLPLKLRRFEGRQNLPSEAIHNEFYPGYEMNEFSELWMEIALCVEVPSGLIRPADRFKVELGPVKGFSIAGEMDDLDDAFITRCNQRSLDYRKMKIETVDDYIRASLEPCV